MPQVRADQHGTRTGYTYGYRCADCREAARVEEQNRARRRGVRPRTAGVRTDESFEALRDVLHELFPHGLTDDCPAAALRATTTA